MNKINFEERLLQLEAKIGRLIDLEEIKNLRLAYHTLVNEERVSLVQREMTLKRKLDSNVK